jgi:hypothetical protein
MLTLTLEAFSLRQTQMNVDSLATDQVLPATHFQKTALTKTKTAK